MTETVTIRDIIYIAREITFIAVTPLMSDQRKL